MQFTVETKHNCSVGICSPHYRAPDYIVKVTTEAGTFSKTFHDIDEAYRYGLSRGATLVDANQSAYHRNAVARVQFELSA